MSSTQELAQSIVHRYLTLMRYQRYSSSQAMKMVNIPGGQLAVLRFLIDQGPVSVNQVSRFLYVREATASLMLDRMEQAGLVKRSRCQQDNRKVLAEPTDYGRQIVLQAPMTAIGLMRIRLPAVDIETLQEIDCALEKLSQIIEVDESVLD